MENVKLVKFKLLTLLLIQVSDFRSKDINIIITNVFVQM
jgi:hypothetical protein